MPLIIALGESVRSINGHTHRLIPSNFTRNQKLLFSLHNSFTQSFRHSETAFEEPKKLSNTTHIMNIDKSLENSGERSVADCFAFCLANDATVIPGARE
jgi:hypothetical protein